MSSWILAFFFVSSKSAEVLHVVSDLIEKQDAAKKINPFLYMLFLEKRSGNWPNKIQGNVVLLNQRLYAKPRLI